MGNSTLCHCKCNDTGTEGNLQQIQDDSTLNENGYDIKAKGLKRDHNNSQQKDLVDLVYIKHNASAYQITKFLRSCKDKKMRHNQKNNLNEYSRLVCESNTSLSTKQAKQKMMFKEKSTKYIGQKVDDNKEGFGIQLWVGGGKYVGYFINNKAHGYGIFVADGDRYEGQFHQDGANGFGIYHHSNGAFYTGDWNDDSQEPYGIETWTDGSTYQGQYHQGKKQGLGIYKWPDGATYEGEWNNNNLQGYGVYYFNNNQAYLGEWSNNMKNGFGEFIWENKRYIGYYINDKKEGFGIYYWKNVNKVFIGFWGNGKQIGFGKYMTPVKQKYGVWNTDSKIQWCTDEKDQAQYLDSKEYMRYKKIFSYTLEEMNAFLNYHDQTDNLLIPVDLVHNAY